MCVCVCVHARARARAHVTVTITVFRLQVGRFLVFIRGYADNLVDFRYVKGFMYICHLQFISPNEFFLNIGCFYMLIKMFNVTNLVDNLLLFVVFRP